MKGGDIWHEAKLHKITWRFVSSWHPKDEQTKKRQKGVLSALKEQNIINFLTSTNPTNTIPPYDDMNNRGAVKCQTLRLNEEYLNINMPSWREITHKLASVAQKENVNDSTVKGYSEESTLLHRILDTSSQIDAYELRAKNPSLFLQKTLANDTNKFHSFAQDYYDLIRSKVRTGIWTKDYAMLKVCGHNPPYKNNQIHNLVAGILGRKITAEQFTDFELNLWNAEFGARKFVSYCKNIEKLRKSHGNLFKSYTEELFKEDKTVFTNDEQKDKELLDAKILNEWIEKTGEFFGIDEQYRARFSNHFSMAQLYTIIETKRSGFNSTCKWCESENQYRATTYTETNQETGEVTTNANAQILSSRYTTTFQWKN